MKWFFVVNKEAVKWFTDMIRVAVLSAKCTGKLEPHCITDDDSDPLFDWLRAEGVEIHVGRLPFRDRLFADDVIEANKGSFYRPVNAAGAYLKILIPQFATPGELIMYTDCDILFLETLSFDGVAIDNGTLNAVAEISSDIRVKQTEAGIFNSGVMIFDPALFQNRYDELIALLEDNKYYFHGDPGFYDQGLFNVAFKGTWKSLPDRLNWRPYWGLNQDASIIHFHGPKPAQVHRIMNDKVSEDEHQSVIRLYEEAPEAYRYYLDMFDRFNTLEALAV